jgi:Carboxypeptidase regulatory-like domain
MTHKSLAGIAVLIVANGLVGCGNHAASAPSALSPPSGVSQPNTPVLVVFKDPLTGLSTSDVRDGQGHIVQFTTGNELIWIDGSHLSGHQVGGPGHPLPGNIAPEASCQCWLVVRFGAADGERRAYMTADVGHYNPGTVVDLEITGTALAISWTDLFPPGTYTLSGYVTEATATGLVPIENAAVSRVDEEQGGWDYSTTDKNGFYQLHGLSDGSREATFSKEGYQQIHLADVPVHGDTRFDIQLLRR